MRNNAVILILCLFLTFSVFADTDKKNHTIGFDRVSKTKQFCNLTSKLFFLDSNNTTEDAEIIKPFSFLKNYWVMSIDDLKDMSKNTVQQLKTFKESFGEQLDDIEFVETKYGSQSFVRHTFLVKYEKSAIRYHCTFYKARDLWYVHSINWDNMISLLFD